MDGTEKSGIFETVRQRFPKENDTLESSRTQETQALDANSTENINKPRFSVQSNPQTLQQYF
jgi:hypothetical protein